MNKREADRVRRSYDTCRTLGHAWFEVDAETRPLFGFYIWVRCERCNTLRRDTIDAHGELGVRSYDYPEGYKDSEKVTRPEYRLRMISARPKRRKRTA